MTPTLLTILLICPVVFVSSELLTIPDLAPPFFTNLPAAIDLDEKTAIDTPVFTVKAVDPDLYGIIVYNLVGQFPVQSFINVNSYTGVVTLRNSLLSDSTQNYTARFTACDSMNPSNIATGDLTIRVLKKIKSS